VEGASGDRVVRTIRTANNPADAGPCDLYIVATKASGVGPAAQAIAPHCGPEMLVLTIQNGLGAGERTARYMPTENILLGVAEGFGASMVGPGHAHHNAMKLIRLGEMCGGLTKRLEKVAALWQAAGFHVKAFADIDQLIWEKFVCNVAFSAPCTAFDRTIGEVMRDPVLWEIALGCAREAYAAGRAKGVAFSFEDPVAYVSAFGAKMPDARPSMLLDHHAGRPSEIDAINGMVPVLGRELGIATPYNQVLTAIIKSREAEFTGKTSR